MTKTEIILADAQTDKQSSSSNNIKVPVPKENTPAKREYTENIVETSKSSSGQLTLPVTSTSGSRLALSADEIEAERSISGGNLSKGSCGNAAEVGTNAPIS